MSNLNRVQVYLNQDNVDMIDQLANTIKISRSQIIRDAVSAATIQYYRVWQFLKKKPKKTEKNPLLELAGIEKSKTGTVGLNVDEIYEHD